LADAFNDQRAPGRPERSWKSVASEAGRTSRALAKGEVPGDKRKRSGKGKKKVDDDTEEEESDEDEEHNAKKMNKRGSKKNDEEDDDDELPEPSWKGKKRV